MKPANGTAVLRPDLSVVVHEAMSNAAAFGFIGSEVCPYFPVAAQSADFPVLPLKSLFNVEKVHRASGSGYQRSTETFEAGHYSCRERGHEHPVDDRFRAMYRSQIDVDNAAVDICTNKVLRAYEIEVAKKVTKPANFLTKAAAAKWNVYDTADPKQNIEDAKEAGRKKGISYNALIITWKTYLDLTRCKKVRDAVFYIFPESKKTGTIGLQQLEAYLDIEIKLAGAMMNASNRAKNPDLQDIWDDSVAVLARVAPKGSQITEPSIGRTFLWNEGASEEIIVEEYYEEASRSNIIRVRHDIDVRLLKSYNEDGNVLSDISKNCGYVITGIR
ncbi:hypothetical protein [Desulfovibrio oxyclinae]|uniref:hypothetical protein n=1 Tax=Desulfovibrio oxyclinae TaxID=63560 RepID=UPI00037B368F|nr:hypothetical protein [Desulfovibrio oxyclinae]